MGSLQPSKVHKNVFYFDSMLFNQNLNLCLMIQYLLMHMSAPVMKVKGGPEGFTKI